MKLTEAIKILKEHNDWRRDLTALHSEGMVDPKKLGEAIDLVVETFQKNNTL